jgi:hydrogenase maturation protease
MTETPRILIACVGNIFLGDDAFGVEVARRLAGRPLPEGVRVVDFGIRGFDLTLALLDDTTDAFILVDAAPRGGPPGTLYVIEPEWIAGEGADPSQPSPIEMHAIDPVRVFRLAAALGGSPRRILLVGCEPTPFDPDDDPPMELSPPVRAAIDEAVLLVESLVARIREGRGAGDAGCLSDDPLTMEAIPHESP